HWNWLSLLRFEWYSSRTSTLKMNRSLCRLATVRLMRRRCRSLVSQDILSHELVALFLFNSLDRGADFALDSRQHDLAQSIEELRRFAHRQSEAVERGLLLGEVQKIGEQRGEGGTGLVERLRRRRGAVLGAIGLAGDVELGDPHAHDRNGSVAQHEAWRL